MDGSSATAAIRTIEKERGRKRAYIVALTGLAAEKDRQIAFDSGVDHFLTKPVSLKKLGEVIEEWERIRIEQEFGVKSDLLSPESVSA
jgi:CheY-like chemotaxis protein